MKLSVSWNYQFRSGGTLLLQHVRLHYHWIRYNFRSLLQLVFGITVFHVYYYLIINLLNKGKPTHRLWHWFSNSSQLRKCGVVSSYNEIKWRPSSYWRYCLRPYTIATSSFRVVLACPVFSRHMLSLFCRLFGPGTIVRRYRNWRRYCCGKASIGSVINLYLAV